MEKKEKKQNSRKAVCAHDVVNGEPVKTHGIEFPREFVHELEQKNEKEER